MLLGEHLPGIVWSGFLGLVIGNFSTSPIYRLPRGESLVVQDPYCDTCHAKLGTGDLFPVLSWLKSRGKCRYCGAHVPAIYTVIELLISVLFVLCYLKFGFSERFLLVSLGMTSMVMMLTMLYSNRFFSDRTLLACLILGMLYRTLQDGSIYGFAGGGFTGLLGGVAAWKLSRAPLIRDIRVFPTFLKLLVAAGVWLPLFPLVALIVAVLLLVAVSRNRLQPAEWAIICTTVALTLFYPHFIVSL